MCIPTDARKQENVDPNTMDTQPTSPPSTENAPSGGKGTSPTAKAAKKLAEQIKTPEGRKSAAEQTLRSALSETPGTTPAKAIKADQWLTRGADAINKAIAPYKRKSGDFKNLRKDIRNAAAEELKTFIGEINLPTLVETDPEILQDLEAGINLFVAQLKKKGNTKLADQVSVFWVNFKQALPATTPDTNKEHQEKGGEIDPEVKEGTISSENVDKLRTGLNNLQDGLGSETTSV